MLLTDKSINRYHILEQLGQGGMATVYKAYDTRLERDVALKIIRRGAFPPEVLDRVLTRFEREAKVLAHLNHANIVSVLDYGEYEGSPYLVMPFIEGGTLKQHINGPMPWQEAVRIVLAVAQALEHAHQRKIIHRDVKPSNILITKAGHPMLSDFGIAKLLEFEEGHTLTGTGVGVGTPEYMAPEQGLGKDVDGRADVYALGVVMYELVTGRKPYTADTPLAVLLKQVNDPLPRPRDYVTDLPDEVERVLFKALAKRPEDRYSDMAAFAQALEKLGQAGNSKENQKPQISQWVPNSVHDILEDTVTADEQAVSKHIQETNRGVSYIRRWMIPIGLIVIVIGLGKGIQNTLWPIQSPRGAASVLTTQLVTEAVIPTPTKGSQQIYIPLETATAEINNREEVTKISQNENLEISGKIAYVSNDEVFLYDLEKNINSKLEEQSSSIWANEENSLEYKDDHLLWIDENPFGLVCTGSCNVHKNGKLISGYGGSSHTIRLSDNTPVGCNTIAEGINCPFSTCKSCCKMYYCPDTFTSVLFGTKKYFVEGSSKNYFPVWSPNGDQFLYLSLGEGDVDLIVNGQNYTPYVKGEIMNPVWSMDGSMIAFAIQIDPYNQSKDICFINLESREYRCVTHTQEDEAFPSWSPDGKTISFSRKIDDNYEIFILNIMSKREKRITNNTVDDILPIWSPFEDLS